MPPNDFPASTSTADGVREHSVQADTQVATPPETIRIDGYEILGVLGRGGMGVVYRARQKSLNRSVALKVLLMGGHASGDTLQRFRAEAEIVARLQHPNIVQIYEVGTSDGHPFLSLEYLPGGSLSEKLSRQPMAPREAATLVRTLAEAVNAAHEAGIVHRDLKPANILLAADGTPKVADFGLAKQLTGSQLTQTGEIMGTPSYMAPEQARGATKTAGTACDVYALGAILYELLSGSPPFRGHDPMEVVLQVISQEPVSLRRLAPNTPRDLEVICHKCLEKPPGKRYASARELADDLGRYLAGEPITARPASKAEKAVKWMRRRPAWAALIAVSTLSVTAFLAYGFWKNRQLASALRSTEQARDRAEGNLRRAIDAAARRISRASDTSTHPLREELKFLEEIRRQPDADAAVRNERALASGWAGYIYSELGDSAAAENAFGESIATFTALCEQFPEKMAYRRDRANFVARYAAFLAKVGDGEGARREYERAVQLLETLVKQHPDQVDCRILLAAECNNLAIATRALGGDPLPHYRRAMQLREQLVAQFPNEPTHRYDLTVSQLNTTAVMLANREYREAETLLRACLGQLAAAPDSLRVESEYRRSLAASHLNLGIALENLSKPEEATAEYEQGIRVLDELMQTYPRSIPLRTMLIDGLNNRFRHQVGQNQMAEALEAADRVMQLCRQLNEEFPDREDFAAGLKKQRELVERIRQLAPKPDGAPTPASSTER